MSVVIAAKILVLLVYLKWVWTCLKMIALGFSVNRESAVHPTEHEEFAPRVYWWTALMITAASLLHLFVRHHIGGEQGGLFMLHLPAVIAFVLALVLMRRYPGTMDVVTHRLIARWLLVPSFIVTALTGPVLIWKL